MAQFDYFERKFAAAIAVQVYSCIPTAIEKNCYGCRVRSQDVFFHTTCQMNRKAIIVVCFDDALSMVNKELAEERFFFSCQPRADFIFEDTWFKDLWSNQDWMRLVEDKVVCFQDHIQNEE